MDSLRGGFAQRFPQLARVAGEFSATSGQAIGLKVLAFIGTSIFVRSVSAAEWGRWAFASSAIAVATVLVQLGAHRAAKRQYVLLEGTARSTLIRTLMRLWTLASG